jgi:thymidylate synthase (FAD)
MEATYIDHMGSDLTVTNSARVSFSKESQWEREQIGQDANGPVFDEPVLPVKDCKLIDYLARHGHWTPFSHPMITMRETVPIFVARQRFKHMVGFAYNEVSRRYVDDAPEFFTPDMWRARPDASIKQGSAGPVQHQKYIEDKYAVFINAAEQTYQAMLEAGVAPEQARMVLPQSMYTSYYVTGSLAAWARAYKQRIDPHAQVEIQDLAKQWGTILEPLFPVSWAALTT